MLTGPLTLPPLPDAQGGLACRLTAIAAFAVAAQEAERYGMLTRPFSLAALSLFAVQRAAAC
jgi:hypothetical protein